MPDRFATDARAATRDVNPLATYITVVRRRWPIILLGALIGAASLAYLGRPTGPTRYTASHPLIVNPARSGELGYTVQQLAILAVQGDLRAKADAELGGPPSCDVSASADPDVATLTINATGTDAEACKKAVDTYATVLVDSLQASDQAALQKEIDDANTAVTDAKQAMDDKQAAAAKDPKNTLAAADAAAAVTAYQAAVAQAQTVGKQVVPPAPLTSIQAATATVDTPGGLAGIGVAGRAGLGALMGALVGFAIGLGLDALDRRIRTAARASEAFGVPVVSEVPKSRQASGDSLAPPGSTVMEAYRRLRTVVLLSHTLDESRHEGDAPRGQVVLVGSPGPREGKTTTVAHLAAALGESGLRVLAVSADFRRPRLDRVLGRPSPSEESAMGQWIIGPTSVDNVDIVMARERTRQPARLLRDIGRMIDVARESYDVIVVDTAPVLVANDALELVPHVDDVILAARSRTTSTSAADRTAELLDQVEAKVLGVVLTQVSASETYAYYGYRYGYGSYRSDKDEPVKATSQSR